MKKVWHSVLWMVGVVIWLGAIALLFWAVTADAEGTVYNIIQTLAPPNAPTGGGFVDAAVR